MSMISMTTNEMLILYKAKHTQVEQSISKNQNEAVAGQLISCSQYYTRRIARLEKTKRSELR